VCVCVVVCCWGVAGRAVLAVFVRFGMVYASGKGKEGCYCRGLGLVGMFWEEWSSVSGWFGLVWLVWVLVRFRIGIGHALYHVMLEISTRVRGST